MKKFLTYIIFLPVCMLFFSCAEPGPVELKDNIFPEQDKVEVSVIDENETVTFSDESLESTGIAANQTLFQNIVTVSGFESTYNDETDSVSYMMAKFLDRKFSVKNSKGKILAFRGRRIGTVYFNGIQAMMVQDTVAFLEGGQLRRVENGVKHVLAGKSLPFPYGAKLRFKIDPDNNNFSGKELDIAIPEKLNASAEVSEKNGKKHYSLKWNKGKGENILIIAGGSKLKTSLPNYIFSIKTTDDGFFKFPEWIIKSLRERNFNHYSFLCIRTVQTEYEGESFFVKNNISANSIHHIKIDVQD